LANPVPVPTDGIFVEKWTAMIPTSRVAIYVCLIALLPPAGSAAGGQDASVPLAERGRGAERVIVGRVSSVTPQWQVNEFGDRLIVSSLRITVEETLKGGAESNVIVDVEGGTLGGLTLHVSDLTTFEAGERAVFYLKRNDRGTFVPHLRGQGLLKLDASNRVRGTGVALAEIRRSLAGARQ
jgi:hypothetical protein